MRINANISALNTFRQLNTNQAMGARSLEKLSSGLRINRAGDDAAGLAISEKMRGQIRGLEQASRNAQDGISLIQTAEGALNETHSILQRMRELAVQSANDTATASDRAEIQKEADQLAKEITRVSNTSEFNTKNLLAGGFNSTFHIGANTGQNIALALNGMDAQTLGVAGSEVATGVGSLNGLNNISTRSNQVGGLFIRVTQPTAPAITVTQSGTGGDGVVVNPTAFTGARDTVFMVRVDGVESSQVNAASFSIDGGRSWTNAAVEFGALSTDPSTVTLEGSFGFTIAADATNAVGTVYSFTARAESFTFELATAANYPDGEVHGPSVRAFSDQSSVVIGDAGREVTVNFSFDDLLVGTPQITQTITHSTAAVTAADGSVTTAAVTRRGIDVSTQERANVAITTIDSAITTVSAERSKLGAFQNRLDHTINNLGTSAENLTAAESRIRDVDMAKEIMEFTKNNILTQAAQAMLAQANQLPQGVLQLLR